ncbi:MAG: RNA 2',3'-cyclic phosphodiesterase [Patescibacteria group bacterium]
MLHRIFIAINLPEEIKKELLSIQDQYFEIPAKWTKPENLHLTLAFLGNRTEEEITKVIEAIKELSKNYAPFSLSLNDLSYGPDLKNPKMIWRKIELSNELRIIQSNLNQTLLKSIDFELDKKEFNPHITLARLNVWDFQKINPEERAIQQSNSNLNFNVESIEIMESILKRTGAEYTTLESIKLQ